MVIEGTSRRVTEPRFAGLRMTADEFLLLQDDGHKYELINGVVLMSPSPSYEHSDLAGEVYAQLVEFVRPRKLGKLFAEPGLRVSASQVYQPDIAFYAAGRTTGTRKILRIPPDLVVECLSPRTRGKDLNTKRDDYEGFGVREYWAISSREAWQFVLRDGKYVGKEITGDAIACEVIAGFVLDLKGARASLDGAAESDEEPE